MNSRQMVATVAREMIVSKEFTSAFEGEISKRLVGRWDAMVATYYSGGDSSRSARTWCAITGLLTPEDVAYGR